MSTATLYDRLDTPIGELLLTSNGRALTGVYMESHVRGPRPAADWHRDAGALALAAEQLRAYFAAELHDFALDLEPTGTEFQQRVWSALRTIPYGTTISYAELAQRIGMPSASRAVGAANGQNPISIIIPCHRVIGADGSLTGYGGGLPRKRWLLAHETKSTVDRQ